MNTMLALGFENLVFVLLVLAVVFFQFLTKAAQMASKESNTEDDEEEEEEEPRLTPPPVSRPKRETDEERVRKFLEALGQPPTSKPPAPVQPRPTYRKQVVLPRARPFGSPLPPLTTRPPELPREVRLPEQIPPTRATKVFTPKMPEPPAYEIEESARRLEPAPPPITIAAQPYAIATQPTSITARVETDLAGFLRSTSGLRQAIILREIFGPPRSLQPLDLL